MWEHTIKEILANLTDQQWRIVFNKEDLQMKIINDRAEEMDIESLEIVLGELGDYVQRLKSKDGLPLKAPIDEFNQRRLGINGYTLINDQQYGDYRDIFEVFYDQANIFRMNRYTIDQEKNLIFSDISFNAYINAEEAETLLPLITQYLNNIKKRSKLC
ncbi:hypothetical protein G4D61_09950 [Bacillus ginsengihumi]|uniref:Uncharacterized protein n=1 Tax=Heyndrickxia ginsengihumi TaxID=363870 RepID=A0A0A6V9M2_9BACI|nr:hypothetical protein [Heyndrickxia ginsengihumi]KHD84266.1 hypothetical protein NG54_16725 [Heyndrickxia ginsengihumi]MBE6184210.1 hypothetical protein [Bacillus sp. (in: firmicutes)]MCM3023450.1 hypothetical protein [Heyndrickxia ginsengihumi]NEY20279.1 hypothetical protein [Heyndrickxia ginsengihumi]